MRRGGDTHTETHTHTQTPGKVKLEWIDFTAFNPLYAVRCRIAKLVTGAYFVDSFCRRSMLSLEISVSLVGSLVSTAARMHWNSVSAANAATVP